MADFYKGSWTSDESEHENRVVVLLGSWTSEGSGDENHVFYMGSWTGEGSGDENTCSLKKGSWNSGRVRR